jgi:hypothetical protein
MMEPSKEPVRVTDHAVLRYLERAMGLKIETVREHILQLCVAPAAFGAVCVRSEGLRFVITDGVVVTVTPDHQPRRKVAEGQPAHLVAAEASL